MISKFSYEEIQKIVPSSKGVKTWLNNAVSVGVLDYDKTNAKYVVKSSTQLSLHNTAGTRNHISPAEIEKYDKNFREQSNVGMNDVFLSNNDYDTVFKKIFSNSFSAAISDTSLSNKYYKIRTAKTENMIDELKKDRVLFDSIEQQIWNFDGHNYRKWHNSTCKMIIATCNTFISTYNGGFYKFKLEWTYGNSQKLINLIVKYICVLYKQYPSLLIPSQLLVLGEGFTKIYSELDIPVDRYILRSSWNWNRCHNDKINLPPSKTTTSLYFNDSYVRNWSSWDYGTYIKFQTSLHASLDGALLKPLDWECYAWEEGKYEAKYNSVVSSKIYKALYS